MKTTFTSFFLFCMLCLATNAAFAQFSKTYKTYPNSTYESSLPLHLVDDGKGNICMLGKSDNADIILKRTDFSGSWLSDWDYKNQMGSDFLLKPTRMMKTPGGEYMVVGWCWEGTSFPAYTFTVPYSPFAARFDATGALLWIYKYPSNGAIDLSPALPEPFRKVCIVLAESDPSIESYILTAPSDPTNILSPNQNTAVNAIRIDASGTPIWNKKFVKPVYTPGTDHREFPETIVWMNGSNEYFIGGTYEDISIGISSGSFIMSIDDAGNIVHQYNTFQVGGNPFGHDAIFDASTNEVVMCFTASNSGFSPYGVEQAIVTKFNSFLNPTGTAFYDFVDAIENYAAHIQKNLTDDGYVVAGDNFDQVAVPKPGALSLSILKIPKTLTPPVYYNRYNVSRNVRASGLICHQDNAGLIENYTVVGNVDPFSMSNDMRLVSVDPTTGNDYCSMRTFPYYYGMLDPALTTDIHTDVSYNPLPDPLIIDAVNVAVSDDDCQSAPAPDAYKGAIKAVDGNSPNRFHIYPNLLKEDNKIKLDINVDNAGLITAQLYTIEGKKIAERQFNFEKGHFDFTWDLPLAHSGNYVLKTISTLPEFNKTILIAKR